METGSPQRPQSEWITCPQACEMIGRRLPYVKTLVKNRQLTTRLLPGSRREISRSSVERLLAGSIEPATNGPAVHPTA